MKWFFYFLTVAVLSLFFFYTMKYFDNFTDYIVVIVFSLIVGFYLYFFSEPNKGVGWGLFYGSLTILVLSIGFYIWLSQQKWNFGSHG
jgi:hypothetical protein